MDRFFWSWYREYLLSNYWKNEKVAPIKERCNGICEVIGCIIPVLQVHHLTYFRVGEEPLKDLLGLCKEHHDIVHGSYEYKMKASAGGRIIELDSFLKGKS